MLPDRSPSVNSKARRGFFSSTVRVIAVRTRTDVADVLKDRILSGRYPPGSRMPSTRHIADAIGGSRTTASAALRLLADEGLVTISDRSAAIVRPPQAAFRDGPAELVALRDDLDEIRTQLDKVAGRVRDLLDIYVTHR